MERFVIARAVSTDLTITGTRRGITYTWAFMLLGQIVAISFATNLYFLTLLLSPAQEEDSATTPLEKQPTSEEIEPASKPRRRKWIVPWLIDFPSTFMVASFTESFGDEKHWNRPGFMSALLTPHVLLLIVPTARAILPTRFFVEGKPRTKDSIYEFLLQSNAYFVGRLALRTYKGYNAGTLDGLFRTLLDHPAVSSVGFDVIFCWISWLCWWQT